MITTYKQHFIKKNNRSEFKLFTLKFKYFLRPEFLALARHYTNNAPFQEQLNLKDAFV